MDGSERREFSSNLKQCNQSELMVQLIKYLINSMNQLFERKVIIFFPNVLTHIEL